MRRKGGKVPRFAATGATLFLMLQYDSEFNIRASFPSAPHTQMNVNE